MTGHGLTFVSTTGEAPAPRQGRLVIVLDTTWTPGPGDRPDLVAARQVLGRVVERIDLFDAALAVVDRWAVESGIADTLLVEGTTYWYRLREAMWRWVHERLLWRFAIADLEGQGAVDDVQVFVDEPALLDVVRAGWPGAVDRVSAAGAPSPVASAAEPPWALRASGPLRPLVRLTRLFGRHSGAARAAPTPPPDGSVDRARREGILADRVAALAAGSRPRVIVLTHPGTHQRIGAAGGARQDPLFATVIQAFEERGVDPVLVATGIDHRNDEDWALVSGDDRLLPQFLLRSRWSHPEDNARSGAAVTDADKAIDTARSTPVLLDGLDVSDAFVDALRATAGHIVRTDVSMLARIERLLSELTPTAILLAQEGIRTPWLMSGQRAGIPVVAVQHGVLYAGHAGYPQERNASLCLPSRTCVYGDFERDVLLELAYEPSEVVVTGSPRLDLDATATGAGATATDDERIAVRRELGVADGDRLLVVSSVNLRFLQRSHFTHMLEAVLGGPLPNVHVVVKQHPGEHDEGPYRGLLEGLARAGGYLAPPISIVKDIDLYRLLRAADAHLGLLSTVLTEAVVTGTPNLIAVTDAHADLLGYVAAGVAQPVRTTVDLLAALDDPRPPTAEARAAFLARHFRTGDATARIANAVLGSKSRRTAAAVPSRAV